MLLSFSTTLQDIAQSCNVFIKWSDEYKQKYLQPNKTLKMKLMIIYPTATLLNIIK